MSNEQDEACVAELALWNSSFNPNGKWDKERLLELTRGKLFWTAKPTKDDPKPQPEEVLIRLCENPEDFERVVLAGIKDTMLCDDGEAKQYYTDIQPRYALCGVWEMAWFFSACKAYGVDKDSQYLMAVDWREVCASGVVAICNLGHLIVLMKTPEIFYEITEAGVYRLHNPLGAAFTWGKGFKEFWLHGVRVDEAMVLDPLGLPGSTAFTHPNAEVRRTYVERVGWLHALRDSKLTELDRRERSISVPSGHGKPGRIVQQTERLVQIDWGDDGENPAKFCHVFCPSTNKEYMLRTDPAAKNIQSGLAALHGVDPETYKPEMES